MINELISAHDAAVDFTQYDNDGPDGKPNSGDDDGYVDFIALVHPEQGGECTRENNIWSHSFALSAWPNGRELETNDIGASGLKIRIDDYVIQPGLACGPQKQMIQIGVFAHEFGHAFGLPDLYDTDDENGQSDGVGIWCLMGWRRSQHV